jgi:hypothetical protein
MGFAERIDLLENDAPHNYNQVQRQSVVRWMARWLLKKDEPITEPAIELLSEEEIKCTPNGQVMLLKGARSTYDLNRDYEKKLAKRRRQLWNVRNQRQLLGRVRKLAGIRKLTDLPEAEVEKVGIIRRPGYKIEKLILKPEDGIYLPALMFLPERKVSGDTVLYVHKNGKAEDAEPGGPIEKLAEAGTIVLAVDLRGTGETHKTGQKNSRAQFGPDSKDVFTAYLLGRSYVGMRAEDILMCARFLQRQKDGCVDLIAVGHVSVPALHAAALESDMFGSIKLVRGLVSWSNVIESGISKNQLVNTVHGALTIYDLDNLAATLGDSLSIEEPLNALGELESSR